MTQWLFALIWAGFSAYAFLLAPPNDPQTLDLILRLSTGQWQSLNPLVVALFNLMGLWPIAFAMVLLRDGHERRSRIEGDPQGLPAWPFVVGSFGLGAFAVLPYLALRPSAKLENPVSPTVENKQAPSSLLQLLESRKLAVLLVVGAVLLLGYGLGAGDGVDFVRQWQTSRFIHVMTLDFLALSLLFPFVALRDLNHRNADGNSSSNKKLIPLTLLPLVGAGLYLMMRPKFEFPEPITSRN